MEVFNVKELANYLKCSVSAVRSLVRKKEIPFFRIGSKLNFTKKEIDLWIHNQELSNLQNKKLSQNEVKSFKKEVGIYDIYNKKKAV